MYNWPGTRSNIALLRRFIINPAKFLGITKYCPLDVVTQKNSKKIVMQFLGPLLGMISAYGGGRAKLVPGEVLEEIEMGTSAWRSTMEITETELTEIADLEDPTRMRLACKKLIARRLLNLSNLIDVRLEWMVWQAFDNMFVNFEEDGLKFSINYQDFGLPAATIPDDYWDDFATANPILDLQTELRKFVGDGVSKVDVVYNGDVELLMSQNENIADKVGGTNWVGSTGSGEVMNLLKKLVQGDSGTGVRINEMVKHDEIYMDKDGNKKSFLPSDTIFLIGEGEPQYAQEGIVEGRGVPAIWSSTPVLQDDFNALMTSGAPDGGIRPGKYVNIVDETQKSPKQVVLEGGISGMICIQHTKWIRRLRVKQRA